MVLEFFRDLRFGARLLRRSAGFTFVAVLSLALGIGGATAVFSLVNAIVLRTLPVPAPHELFQARSTAPGREYGDLFSGPTFEHARDELSSRGAELFAATSVAGMQLQPDGESIGSRGNVQLVSGEYFTALRQEAQQGRLLAPSDNRTIGGHPVAVISDGYWKRHFGGGPDAVGRALAINGTSFTVIGVTRPRFFGTTLALRAPDAWIPYMMQPVVRYSQNASNSNNADPRKPWPPQPEMSWLNVFARVPGAGTGGLEAAFTTVLQRDSDAALSKDATADDRAAIRQQRVALTDASTGLSSLRRTVSPPLYVLLAMVGVLLVIACGNVAGLLLSRAAGRAREMAIRQSMGAGRLRLVRQMLAESLLLAVAGGLLGITFAVWGRDALLALMVNVGSPGIPIDLNTGLDWRVLGFSLAASAMTGIACGVIPAFRGTRVPVIEALKQEGRGSVSEGGRRGVLIGKTLVAAQMAFCLLLLVVAALFTRSFRTLTNTDIGFDRDHVLTARVDVRGAGYSEEGRQALYRRLVDALQAIPGVQAVSMSANGPLGGSQRISSLTVEGYTPGRDERLRTNEEMVTDRYFETMGLTILDGRGFRAEDRAPGSHSTVINATMARRFFAAGSAVGKRWDYGDTIGKDSQLIVGVVEDARYVDPKTTPPNMAYVLTDNSPDDVLSDIELRTAVAPGTLAQTVRETLGRIEPRLPIVEVVPLGDRLARGVIQDRMVARLTVMFGALALLLASLGLYGTISYGISRRVAELGLRMALGADRPTVLWMVLREALSLVLVGALIGLPLAFAAGRSMKALLYGVGATDPVSFAAGAAILILVAAVAAYLPAHRASRIEPMVALGR